MRPSRLIRSAIALAAIAASASLVAQERDRSKVPDKYKWNLADIYPSDAAWRADKEKLVAEIPAIGQFRGTLGTSAARLADALDLVTRLNNQFARLSVYASLAADQDTRVSSYQAMQQEMVQIGANLGAEAAFIDPEILKLEPATIDRFLREEQRLAVYRHYLHDLQRRRDHTLSDAEEKILAASSVVASAPGSIYNIFSNADFPYPSVTLSSGKTVEIDSAGFTLYRALPSREDRQKVMSAFFGALGAYGNTFGTTLNAQIQSDVFYARSRKYETSLDAALDGPNIPRTVYMRLVEGVNKHLPTFHRYLSLRKRMMGLQELHYYDLYAPLVGSVDLTYSVEEAQQQILAALKPMGADYIGVATRAFNDRWIDMYPTEGKRSGAYSNGGAYDVHPYILMNYNGKYTDMSTLAHELGHAMHSYYSNKTQPFATASYPIFVAEVASTFNEELLIERMLAMIKDPKARLSLLGNYLENIKGTVFRQTQFAEFELRAHELAEKGQPLTGEALDKLYAEITRKYYGHDKKVSIVDDYIAHEWSYIPHFYRTYYVFQYATSFTASVALASKVLDGDPAATKRYLSFLSAGGSKYPIDLLKDAGVDMTTPEPLELTMKKMNREMDDMEKLLAQ